MVSTANYTKLKTNLSLCIQRLKLLEKKKTELAQKSRKEIAEYISQGKQPKTKSNHLHIITFTDITDPALFLFQAKPNGPRFA